MCVCVYPSLISLVVSVDIKHHVYLLMCVCLVQRIFLFNTVGTCLLCFRWSIFETSLLRAVGGDKVKVR